jgi:hypothetical protein
MSTWPNPNTFGERADVLWHVRESQRLVSLAIIAPELMSYEEQHIWALIEENGYFWRGRDVWDFDVDLDSIIRERVDECWEQLVAVAAGEKSPDVLPRAVKPAPVRDDRGYDDEIPF